MSMITGLQAINWYHMRTQLSAMKLEAHGLKHSRGSVLAHVKRTYGLRGNRQKVIEQFERMVNENRPV